MSAEFSAPVRRADERPQTTGPPSPPRSPRPPRNARQLHAAVAQETDAEGCDAVAELVEGDHAAGDRCGDRGQFERPSTGSSQPPVLAHRSFERHGHRRHHAITDADTTGDRDTPPLTAPRSRADQAAHPRSARRRPADDYLAGGIAGDVPPISRFPQFRRSRDPMVDDGRCLRRHRPGALLFRERNSRSRARASPDRARVVVV
jgi:hypothetical protein